MFGIFLQKISPAIWEWSITTKFSIYLVSLKYSRSNFGVRNLTLPTLAVLLNLGLMIILVGARIVAEVLLKMEHFVLLIMLIQKKLQVVSHYRLDIYRNLQLSIYILTVFPHVFSFRGNYSLFEFGNCSKFKYLPPYFNFHLIN